MSLRIEYIAIGDELLDGRVTNTNLDRLVDYLAPLGLSIRSSTIISDEPVDMKRAFTSVFKDTDMVILTGGLGPTDDDRTSRVLAEFLGVPLIRSDKVMADIRVFFEARNRPVYESNFKQADFPEGATVMTNGLGTAPGYYGRYNNVVIAVFPGVPRELEAMWQATMPIIFERYFPNLDLSPAFKFEYWETIGKGESELMQDLKVFYPLPEGLELGFRARFPGVQLRFKVYDQLEDWASLSNRFQEGLGATLLSTDGSSLIQCLAQELQSKQLTVSCAESITAGQIASSLAQVSGASSYLEESYIVYSNAAKHRLLNVAQSTLEMHGPVSQQCVEEMAQTLYKKTAADITLAISGIAGPNSDEHHAPVGQVWIATHQNNQTTSTQYTFQGTRDQIQSRATQTALYHLLKEAQKL